MLQGLSLEEFFPGSIDYTLSDYRSNHFELRDLHAPYT